MARFVKPSQPIYVPDVNAESVRQYLEHGLVARCPYGTYMYSVPRIIGVRGTFIAFQFDLSISKADALALSIVPTVDTTATTKSNKAAASSVSSRGNSRQQSCATIPTEPLVLKKPIVSDDHAAYIHPKTTHCVLDCIAMVPIDAAAAAHSTTVPTAPVDISSLPPDR